MVGAIWNQNTLPSQGDHVFNAHGFTPAGPRAGADNWLTRTRLPDGGYISGGGYRFGSDYWLDFGHPEAATYTVNLLLDLVRNYPIDGLHLDRLQYPEIPASADGGASVGYNDVSLQRFREKYGRPADSDPAANDPDWSDWRREQITALMRRIYLNVVAIKPGVKISVGAIATGNAPGSDGSWPATDAYIARVSGLAEVDRRGPPRHRHSADLPRRAHVCRCGGLRGLDGVDAQPSVSASGRHRHRLLPEFD